MLLGPPDDLDGLKHRTPIFAFETRAWITFFARRSLIVLAVWKQSQKGEVVAHGPRADERKVGHPFDVLFRDLEDVVLAIEPLGEARRHFVRDPGHLSGVFVELHSNVGVDLEPLEEALHLQ